MNLNVNEKAIFKLIVGVGFMIIGDKLNKLGIVDWSTVFLSTAGLILIVFSIIELLKKNK